MDLSSWQEINFNINSMLIQIVVECFVFILCKCKLFPSTDKQSSNNLNMVAAGNRAKALYDFTSDCEEELSLKVHSI